MSSPEEVREMRMKWINRLSGPPTPIQDGPALFAPPTPVQDSPALSESPTPVPDGPALSESPTPVPDGPALSESPTPVPHGPALSEPPTQVPYGPLTELPSVVLQTSGKEDVYGNQLLIPQSKTPTFVILPIEGLFTALQQITKSGKINFMDEFNFAPAHPQVSEDSKNLGPPETPSHSKMATASEAEVENHFDHSSQGVDYYQETNFIEETTSQPPSPEKFESWSNATDSQVGMSPDYSKYFGSAEKAIASKTTATVTSASEAGVGNHFDHTSQGGNYYQKMNFMEETASQPALPQKLASWSKGLHSQVGMSTDSSKYFGFAGKAFASKKTATVTSASEAAVGNHFGHNSQGGNYNQKIFMEEETASQPPPPEKFKSWSNANDSQVGMSTNYSKYFGSAEKVFASKKTATVTSASEAAVGNHFDHNSQGGNYNQKIFMEEETASQPPPPEKFKSWSNANDSQVGMSTNYSKYFGSAEKVFASKKTATVTSASEAAVGNHFDHTSQGGNYYQKMNFMEETASQPALPQKLASWSNGLHSQVGMSTDNSKYFGSAEKAFASKKTATVTSASEAAVGNHFVHNSQGGNYYQQSNFMEEETSPEVPHLKKFLNGSSALHSQVGMSTSNCTNIGSAGNKSATGTATKKPKLTFLKKNVKVEQPQKRPRGRPRKNTQKPEEDEIKEPTIGLKCNICKNISTNCKMLSTPCGHTTHEHCMLNWLNSESQIDKFMKNCTHCGQEFERHQLNPIFV